MFLIVQGTRLSRGGTATSSPNRAVKIASIAFPNFLDGRDCSFQLSPIISLLPIAWFSRRRRLHTHCKCIFMTPCQWFLLIIDLCKPRRQDRGCYSRSSWSVSKKIVSRVCSQLITFSFIQVHNLSHWVCQNSLPIFGKSLLLYPSHEISLWHCKTERKTYHHRQRYDQETWV